MGSTGLECSVLGLGGYHLGAASSVTESKEIVARAMDAGINFFDNAWEYHDGESETRLGIALQGKRDQAVVMTKVCTHGRGKDVAMKMLDESLRRLRTDYLDVWQVHEVIYETDPSLIFGAGGVIEAMARAKEQGKARFVGFTGHKDPSIHAEVLSYGYPFDTIQMPLNCLDATFRSFERGVLPEARRRGMAVFGMKSLGGNGEIVKWGAATAHEALRYAMSVGASTTISGIDSLDVLEQNLGVARGFRPMSDDEMQALRDRCRPYAADGRCELFKTTKLYDAKIGREQHHFPLPEELPL